MTRGPQEIATLFAYTRWANDQTLEPVAGLTAEEFTREIGGSFGSVQGTLAHLCGADWVWLERFHGRSPRSLPPAQETPSFAALREKWSEVQRGQQAFVEALTAARLEEPLAYVAFKGDSFSYPLRDALIHVVNHGTYHRGQVATLLRQLGKTPKSTDYLRYHAALPK